MKLLLITNRKRVTKPSKHPERFFDEEPRLEGAATNEMAMLDRSKNDYSVELIPGTNSHADNTERRISTMASFLQECITQEYDCVLYIHGYGKTFHQSIEQAVELRNRYSNAAVITFSWPSKEREGTVNFREKYREIQEIAKASEGALKEMFSDLREAIKRLPAGSRLSINMVIHSLGNYMFENLIRKNPTLDLTMFDNIISNQADVQITKHKEWYPDVKPKRKVYVTGNRGDVVLMASQILNNGIEDDRLGDSLHHHTIRAANVVYVDFSQAKGIGREHQLFGMTAVDQNNYVRSFFERAFSGKDAVKGESIVWNEEKQYFQMIK